MRYGIVGRTLGHSHSPMIHGLLAPYQYERLEVEPEGLEDLVRGGEIGGLNITMPYKKAVMPFCDSLSDAARSIGSVNTLVVGRDGKITGHNTDYDGFLDLLARAEIGLKGKKVVILGSGGTANTVCSAARDLEAGEIILVSRSGGENYGNLERHRDAQILINTTPVGMFPDNGGLPVDLDVFDRLEAVADVVYNPLQTPLVLEAKKRGIPAAGGIAMLVCQAARAAELFLDTIIPPDKVDEVLRTVTRRVQNIVLIGMPGCGKTTLGRRVAERLGRSFMDTDEMVEQTEGRPVSQIIEQEGEARFRALEAGAVRQAAKGSGGVIATGGGAVLLEENRDALAQNGRIYYITRALDALATQARPLSKNLAELYEQRHPIYKGFCHRQVENNGRMEDTVQRILEEY